MANFSSEMVRSKIYKKYIKLNVFIVKWVFFISKMQEIHKNLFWSATKPPSHQKSTTKVIWLNVRWWPIYHGQKLIYLISKKNIIRQSYMQLSIIIKSSRVCACGFNNIIVMPASTLRVRWNRSPTASLEGKRYDEEWMNKNETAKYYAHQLKGISLRS